MRGIKKERRQEAEGGKKKTGVRSQRRSFFLGFACLSQAGAGRDRKILNQM